MYPGSGADSFGMADTEAAIAEDCCANDCAALKSHAVRTATGRNFLNLQFDRADLEA